MIKKMTKFDKIKHRIVIVSMVFSVTMFFIFMFWWIFPYRTISVSQHPYKVLTPEVKQGQMMTYVIDYCKHTNAIAEVHKQFVDGIIYAVPESSIGIEKGCGSKTISIKVPKTLPPGDYKLKVDVSFKVNPIRVISNSYETEIFSVVK